MIAGGSTIGATEASAGHAHGRSGRSVGGDAERVARVKELEFSMNKRMLMHRLAR